MNNHIREIFNSIHRRSVRGTWRTRAPKILPAVLCGHHPQTKLFQNINDLKLNLKHK